MRALLAQMRFACLASLTTKDLEDNVVVWMATVMFAYFCQNDHIFKPSVILMISCCFEALRLFPEEVVLDLV